MEEVAKLNKKNDELKVENEKLKYDISNYKINIEMLGNKLEDKEFEYNANLSKKEKEIKKLNEIIADAQKENKAMENEWGERIKKMEEKINSLKESNYNLSSELNDKKSQILEYENNVDNLKHKLELINTKMTQTNVTNKNKEMLIEQYKNQINDLNNEIMTKENELQEYEQIKQQELSEYAQTIDQLQADKSTLESQNVELTENLQLASENLKKFNDLINDRYGNIEAELYKQINKNENLEKKFKRIMTQMKNRQNNLTKENYELKELVAIRDMQKEQIDFNLRNNCSSNLNRTVCGVHPVNYDILGNENEIGINQSIEPILGNNILGNGLNNTFSINRTPMTMGDQQYNLLTNASLNNQYFRIEDPKEESQKRTLEEFKNLLEKIDEKLDMNEAE